MAYQCKSIYWLQKLETSTIIYKSVRGAQDRDRITYVQRQSKKQLRPVVQRVDNSIQLVNRYAAEKCEQLTIGKFRDTWEVWRALKKLELLEATPRAFLTHLLCPTLTHLLCSRLRLEQLLRIFCALQTSQVLHISMNAPLTFHNNFNLMV